jgi:hypothetical protein
MRIPLSHLRFVWEESSQIPATASATPFPANRFFLVCVQWITRCLRGERGHKVKGVRKSSSCRWKQKTGLTQTQEEEAEWKSMVRPLGRSKILVSKKPSLFMDWMSSRKGGLVLVPVVRFFFFFSISLFSVFRFPLFFPFFFFFFFSNTFLVLASLYFFSTVIASRRFFFLSRPFLVSDSAPYFETAFTIGGKTWRLKASLKSLERKGTVRFLSSFDRLYF